MGDTSIQGIADSFKGLKSEDLERLFFIIRGMLYPDKPGYEQFVEDLRENKFSAGRTCPHCSASVVIMHGSFKGRQRYRCKACNRTFSDFTKSPMARSRYPEKWVLFAECMLKNMCLKETAKELGITKTTAFYWRHKILKALQKLDTGPFEGITEADETFFLFSEKGKKNITGRTPRHRGGVASRRGLSHEQVCVIVAYDRDRDRILSKVACTGQISQRSIDRVIGPFVSPATVLCTDAAHGYRPYCKKKQIRLVQLEKDQRKHGIYHIQNVNSYHSHLKGWIRMFYGIASKYLDDYLAWFGFRVKNAQVAMNAKMKAMIIEACVKGLDATWDSLRFSKFEVAV
ncbi:MAG: IS1595 family transposase [Syntrophorhabdales bacterium]